MAHDLTPLQYWTLIIYMFVVVGFVLFRDIYPPKTMAAHIIICVVFTSLSIAAWVILSRDSPYPIKFFMPKTIL